MASIDDGVGSELFSNYEGEMKLVQADLNQQLDQLADVSGEQRKAAIAKARRSLEEANELLESMRLEKGNLSATAKQKATQRLRNYEHDVDVARRQLDKLGSDKAALFGKRYLDNPSGGDEQLEQRQQLLSGTDRLERSSGRLRESQRIALETEAIGQGTLGDLSRQREQIMRTRDDVLDSEGYVDRSNKTLKGMARRMATNKLITIAIITVLVLLIIAVIISKFR